MRVLLALVAVAPVCLGCYNHVKHAKESVLREELFTLRQSIDQYTQDKKRAPETLQDLVAHGYLRAIPNDPFTDSSLTWQMIYGDSPPALQDPPAVPPSSLRQLRKIIDVHSGSDQIATDGTRYKDW